LFYKLFSSFKIDRAMNILSRQVARTRVKYFSRTKNIRLLNLNIFFLINLNFTISGLFSFHGIVCDFKYSCRPTFEGTNMEGRIMQGIDWLNSCGERNFCLNRMRRWSLWFFGNFGAFWYTKKHIRPSTFARNEKKCI